MRHQDGMPVSQAKHAKCVGHLKKKKRLSRDRDVASKTKVGHDSRHETPKRVTAKCFHAFHPELGQTCGEAAKARLAVGKPA